MGKVLELLAKTLYQGRPPQHAPPLGLPAKDKSELEYKVFSSKVKIRATRECNFYFTLSRPATFLVQGGRDNTYSFSGSPEVLAKSKIIYLGGSGNSIPENIGEIIVKGGDKLKFY